MKKVLIYIIKAYKFFSKFTASHCRFTPSCSTYAMESIEKHGAMKGAYFGAARILKCNPFFRGGYDPVK